MDVKQAYSADAREISEIRSSFEYSSTHKEMSVTEYLQAFDTSCGRFKLPMSWKTRMELLMAMYVTKSEIFTGLMALSRYQVPPSWQILLNYLHQEGILTAPTFQMRRRANDFPPGFSIALKAFASKQQTDGREVESVGYSNHPTDFLEALSKSVGEVLERYFLTLYQKKSLQSSSYTKLLRAGKNVLPLPELNSYLPWQKKAFRHMFDWDNETTFRWVAGKELLSKRSTFMPAQLVFRSYDLSESNEPTLMDLNTNGGAGHFSFEEAVLSALHELVERDGFLVHWLNTLSPPLLDVSSFQNLEVERMLQQVARYKLRAFFLDTTSDIGIPSCACAVLDERGKEPIIAVGAGAGFNPVQNILASAREAVSTLSSLSASEGFALPRGYQPFNGEPVIGKRERLSLWRGNAMLKQFQFFISGPHVSLSESRFMSRAREFGSLQDEYAAVLDIFRSRGPGYEIYCHSVRHRVLEKIGYHVVQVVVPKLIPLYLTEHRATLDAARLRDVPRLLGYASTKLNPLPHPFP